MTNQQAHDIIRAGSNTVGSDNRFPHCDSRVLHAPGDCTYCDKHPDWQALRILWGISFTGKAEQGKLPCPAEWARPYDDINKWHGNKADGH